jgi:hypothetical protein
MELDDIPLPGIPGIDDISAEEKQLQKDTEAMQKMSDKIKLQTMEVSEKTDTKALSDLMNIARERLQKKFPSETPSNLEKQEQTIKQTLTVTEQVTPSVPVLTANLNILPESVQKLLSGESFENLKNIVAKAASVDVLKDVKPDVTSYEPVEVSSKEKVPEEKKVVEDVKGVKCTSEKGTDKEDGEIIDEESDSGRKRISRKRRDSRSRDGRKRSMENELRASSSQESTRKRRSASNDSNASSRSGDRRRKRRHRHNRDDDSPKRKWRRNRRRSRSRDRRRRGWRSRERSRDRNRRSKESTEQNKDDFSKEDSDSSKIKDKIEIDKANEVEIIEIKDKESNVTADNSFSEFSQTGDMDYRRPNFNRNVGETWPETAPLGDRGTQPHQRNRGKSRFDNPKSENEDQPGFTKDIAEPVDMNISDDEMQDNLKNNVQPHAFEAENQMGLLIGQNMPPRMLGPRMMNMPNAPPMRPPPPRFMQRGMMPRGPFPGLFLPNSEQIGLQGPMNENPGPRGPRPAMMGPVNNMDSMGPPPWMRSDIRGPLEPNHELINQPGPDSVPRMPMPDFMGPRGRGFMPPGPEFLGPRGPGFMGGPNRPIMDSRGPLQMMPPPPFRLGFRPPISLAETMETGNNSLYI